MRKMIAAVVLCVAASPAFAQHGRHHQHHHHDHHRGYGWVGPAVIGAAIGGVLIAAQRGYSQPAPVYYPPVQYQYQQPQTMFKRVDVYIPECNCTRTIEVQIQ